MQDFVHALKHEIKQTKYYSNWTTYQNRTSVSLTYELAII